MEIAKTGTVVLRIADKCKVSRKGSLSKNFKKDR